MGSPELTISLLRSGGLYFPAAAQRAHAHKPRAGQQKPSGSTLSAQRLRAGFQPKADRRSSTGTRGKARRHQREVVQRQSSPSLSQTQRRLERP